MAQPKSILEEQLTKGEEFRGLWPWRLLLVTGTVFFILVFIYFGMIFGYGPYLNSKINALDQKISDLNNQVTSEDTKNLVNLYSQLVNINTLIKFHPLPSKLFNFLETTLNSGVYLRGVDLVYSRYSLRIDGTAFDYLALSRQLAVWKKQPQIKLVSLQNSKLTNKNDVEFSVQILITQDLVK